MSKVLKVLSLSFLLCLSLVVAPFHISALSDDLPAPFIGVNIYQDDIEYTGPYGTYWIYKSGDNYRVELQGVRFNTNIPLWHYDFVLDSNYVGDVTVSYTSGSNNISSIYYINGNHLEINIAGQVTTFTISDVHLNNIGDGNKWFYPIESYNFIDSFFKQGFEQKPLVPYNNYYFPSFVLPQNTRVWGTSFDNDLIMVFAINKYLTASNFNNFFKMEDGFTVTYENINYLRNVGGYTSGRIVKYTFHRTDGVYSSFYLDYIGSDAIIMPIFCNYSDKYVSTDFALQFGLSNPLLDAIVYGTDSSNQSASNLDDKTNDLNASSNQLVTQEDAFNDDMNNALQNIDTNFNVGSNFGSKFVASADWVKTQYDRLTGNTPFGSVISFSLLIGLALLLVGKVFK